MTDFPPLYQMNPLERFSDRASAYAKYRPAYPAVAIDALLNDLGSPPRLIVADIGAGTGIASRLLAERGVQVYAIEPNVAMQQAAIPHPRVAWLTGSAEVTGLAADSVNLVTCFQAFHWFNPDASLLEFRRILRLGGRLALVWNDLDLSDGFTASYRELIRIASSRDPVGDRQSQTLSSNTLAVSSLFTNFRSFAFCHRQLVDLEALVGRAQSTSYVPREGASYEKLVTDLEDLYEQTVELGSQAYLAHTTNVYLAEATL